MSRFGVNVGISQHGRQRYVEPQADEDSRSARCNGSCLAKHRWQERVLLRPPDPNHFEIALRLLRPLKFVGRGEPLFPSAPTIALPARLRWW